MNILVVEDDPAIASGLRIHLQREGYQVRHAMTGDEALACIAAEVPDLLLLDVMLPGKNGFEVLREVRAQGLDMPVLMLSARDGEDDKVLGLELGAEDYVAKPFSTRELLARVKAALRRRRASPAPRWSFGDVEVDPASRAVSRSGVPVELTPTEWDLLVHFARRAGEAISREEILRAVWGTAPHVTSRTVDNFVAQLRAKLERTPDAPVYFKTVRGIGYRLDIPKSPASSREIG